MSSTCAKCRKTGLTPEAADDESKSHKVNERDIWEKYNGHCSTGKTKPKRRDVLCGQCYKTMMEESQRQLDSDSNNQNVITESSLNSTAVSSHQSTKANTQTGKMEDSERGTGPRSSRSLKRSLDVPGSEPAQGQCNLNKKRVTDGRTPPDLPPDRQQTTGFINNKMSLQIPIASPSQGNCSTAGHSPSAEQRKGEFSKSTDIQTRGQGTNNSEKSKAHVPRSYLLDKLKRNLNDGSLCNLKFTVTCEGKVTSLTNNSREFPGNSCIMQLWKLKYQNHVFTMGSIKEVARLSDALEAYLKFLHTGEILTFDGLCNILANYKQKLVNDFIFGLAFIQGLYALGEIEQLRTLQQELNQTASSLPMTILTMCTRDGSDRKHTIRDIYDIIIREWDWSDDEKYSLEGPGGCSRRIEKEQFFSWLFTRFSMDPAAPILSLVFETLVSSPSPGIKDEFGVKLNSTNSTNAENKIRVHPVILQIRQETANHEEYFNNITAIREYLQGFSCNLRDLKTFVDLLYGQQSLEDVQTNASVSAMVRLCQAFLVKPIPLLYGDVDVNDPNCIRIFMDILEGTGDKKYSNLILTDPYKYLLRENIKSLKTEQLCTILEDDSLAMEEIDLYNVVIEFCKETSCEDEDAQKEIVSSRFNNKLAFYIRFGIMSKDEYKKVENPCYLPQEDMLLFYYILRNPNGNMKIPVTFIKPTVRRLPPSAK